VTIARHLGDPDAVAGRLRRHQMVAMSLTVVRRTWALPADIATSPRSVPSASTLGRSMKDDVRPSLGQAATQWSWTGRVGGADFLR
jgi:hypothetical protein